MDPAADNINLTEEFYHKQKKTQPKIKLAIIWLRNWIFVCLSGNHGVGNGLGIHAIIP